MFGSQRDFDNRTAEYRSNLGGIKHLHRLRTQSESPTRPQPNQPIALHVTTSRRYCLRRSALLDECKW